MKTKLYSMIALILLATLSLLSLPAGADEAPMISVEVGQARVKRTIAAFPTIIATHDAEGKLRSVREIAMTDLDFSGLFDFLNPAAFVEDSVKAGVLPGTFKMTDWSSIGAELVVKGKGSVDATGITLEIYVYAAHSGKQLLAKRYKSNEDSIRKMAHTVSNDVLFALTGKKGPFTSKIAFVSDRTGKKEIYVMDYDGSNPIKVTSRFAHAMSPAWSRDGKQLVFTALTKNSRNVRNHNLFVYDLPTGKINMLSNRQGINSGAVFSPVGRQIALTMSFPGNAEIFLMDPDTKVVQRLTNSFGLDVDPSWSPDGKHLAFVSDRSGRPMIYKMEANGANVQRLTFAGYYNATPSWSPVGGKLVFAGWDAGKFDIFLMNVDGTNIERLTKNMGDNEDPDFAPDGYFIAYSSNRKGKRNLYITNVDNTVHRQITSDFGNCESPRWSNAN